MATTDTATPAQAPAVPQIGYVKPQLVHVWRINPEASNIQAIADATGSALVDDHGTPVLVTADGETATAGQRVVRMPGGRLTVMLDTTYTVMIGEDFESDEDGDVRAPVGDWWTLTRNGGAL